MLRQLSRYVLQTLALAAVYVAVARLGLMLGAVNRFAAPVWPPTGVSLAALLLWGNRFWPGIALGAFTVNHWIGAPVPVALGVGVGNTLEAVAGAFLLRRLGGFQRSLDHLRQVIGLIALGALASTTISATVGVSSLLLGGLVSGGELAETWRVWWLGNLVGDLMVAPLLLAWSRARRFHLGPRQLAEAAAVGASVIGASLLIFARSPTSQGSEFLQACLLLALLIWSALRFGLRGSTATVFLASAVAVWGATLGRGPFVQDTLSQSLLLLQAFMGIVAATLLVLGAVIAERAEALRQSEVAQHRSEMLASLGVTLNAARDLQEVLKTGAVEAAKLLGGDGGALWLAQPDDHHLRGVFEIQPAERVGAELDLGGFPHSRLAVEQRRPVYFTRAEAAGAEPGWLQKLGIEAALAIPLVTREGVAGILHTDYQQDPGRKPQGDLDFALAVGGLCALALARAQVFEEQKRARRQAELAEEEARRQGALLSEADRRKSEFLGVLSHELRNPLTPIRNALHILRHVTAGSDQASRAKDIIERQTNHLSRLVDDLLDITRISQGKIQLHRRRIDLTDVVRHVVEDHRPLFAARGIALGLRIETGPRWVEADPTRLAQVTSNLLQNAARFTNARGHVIVSVRQGGASRAVVQITDDGIGIAPEVLPRIFEPFTQADESLHRGLGGLGLGLAFANGLIKMHGGTIEARSQGIGHGSEFTFSLPLADESAVAAGPPSSRKPPLARQRVLVIEDNPDAAETLKEVLEMSDQEVAVAHDGQEGLAKVRALKPDVVLCDIGLPRLNGYEVARQIRADPGPSPTLVAMTGYALPDDQRRAFEAGFDHHLAKPFELGELERILSHPASQPR